MQNISYVLSLMGRDWLTGLKPAKNVGANVAAEIEALLAQAEGRKSVPVAAFEIAVREEAKKKNLLKPTGNRNPKATSSERSHSFNVTQR
jgi:5-methylcytosine-specific restriction protein A